MRLIEICVYILLVAFSLYMFIILMGSHMEYWRCVLATAAALFLKLTLQYKNEDLINWSNDRWPNAP